MKCWIILFIVFVFFNNNCAAECPPDQYDPGPDCSFEVICGVRSAHSYRRHYCDCWCKPGLIRDSETGLCVEKCP